MKPYQKTSTREKKRKKNLESHPDRKKRSSRTLEKGDENHFTPHEERRNQSTEDPTEKEKDSMSA